MSEAPVLLDLDAEGVLTLTLNRPTRRNAFNPGQFLALGKAFAAANDDPNVAAVVLTGAGEDFTSGLDLADMGGASDGPQPFEVMMDALCALDKPLLAAARGFAIGFGVTVLFHCDVVTLGRGTRLRMPFTNLGLVTEAAACYLAPEVMGRKAAAELIFTAEFFDAGKALETGIASTVVPDEEVLEVTLERAHRIARMPVTSLVEIKRLMKQAHAEPIARARELEMAGMMKLAGSPENLEAVNAFLTKRDPDFKQFRA
jgi:enoyl-CoA hydratase/carnithine racemase